MTIKKATDRLTIELMTSQDEAGKPLLVIQDADDTDQAVIVYLPEVKQLIDALASAASQLAQLEAELRQRGNGK